MEVEQATRRLLELLEAKGGSLTAADVEADSQLAQDQATVSAAAHALATESDIATREESDGREWFPYSLMIRDKPTRA
jgi:hypothetical protein